MLSMLKIFNLQLYLTFSSPYSECSNLYPLRNSACVKFLLAEMPDGLLFDPLEQGPQVRTFNDNVGQSHQCLAAAENS